MRPRRRAADVREVLKIRVVRGNPGAEDPCEDEHDCDRQPNEAHDVAAKAAPGDLQQAIASDREPRRGDFVREDVGHARRTRGSTIACKTSVRKYAMEMTSIATTVVPISSG